MRPMLATTGTHVPTEPGWSHEVKWDGVRVLADTTRSGTTRLLSRNENPVTVAWPELNRSPLGDRDLLVDGEVIALNDRGLPDFRVLQDRMHVRNAAAAARLADRLPATYMVFDVMRVDGKDVSDQPLGERRKILRGLGPGALDVAGPRGLRRRADAVRGHPPAGPRGDRQQAAHLALRLRRADPELAEVRAPAPPLLRRGRLAPAGGHHRPAGRAAGRGADRARGWSTAGRVGSGIGARGQPGAHRRSSPRIARADSPFDDEVPADRRPRHVLGRPGAGRRRRDPRRRLHAAPPAVVPRRRAPTSRPGTCGATCDRRAGAGRRRGDQPDASRRPAPRRWTA